MMEQTLHKIGSNIAALRKAKGLTQEQLAAQLGVSAPAVSKWETNASYPDITLLCPLARALDTNVDTLLQFEETLSDQEVTDQINALIQEAMDRDGPAGWQTAEQRLEELLHRYPNCTTLQYNAVAAYDTFLMFFPTVDQTVREKWRQRQHALLERVRAGGSAAYWQSATLALASDEIAYGDPEKGAALLRELPKQVGDPASVWALYHLKKEQPEEALKLSQKQLYKLVSQTQNCLATMINPRVIPSPQKLLKLAQAYHTMAQTFGLLDTSSGLQMEIWLRMEQPEKAAACLAEYVEVLTGPAVYPDKDFFAPGLKPQKKEGQPASTREMRRLLLKSLEEEYADSPLKQQPLFAKSLEKLRASL